MAKRTVRDTPDQVKLIDAALSYVHWGWRVFPLHQVTCSRCSCGNTECAPGGKNEKNIAKHPRTKHGVTDATSEAAQIRRWWTKWPDANIGIATGPESGLLVVDIDGNDVELPGVLRDLPRTVTARTSRGLHLYLRYPTAITIGNSVKKMDLPVDVRGAGGYVVAPPSLHQSGTRYEWLVKPEDCELAEPSPELLAWLSASKASSAPINTRRVTTEAHLLDRVGKYLDTCPPAISGQRGHDATFTVVCAIVNGFALDPETAHRVLQSWNARCQPPWTDKELRHKVDDALKVQHDRPRGYLIGSRARRDTGAQSDTAGTADAVDTGTQWPTECASVSLCLTALLCPPLCLKSRNICLPSGRLPSKSLCQPWLAATTSPA